MSQPASPPLRLTRRGRLAVTITVVATLVMMLALLSSLGSQARPEEPALAGAPVAAGDLSAATDEDEAPARAPKPTPVAQRAVSQSGSGELSVVGGRSEVSNAPSGPPADPPADPPAGPAVRVVQYRVMVEDGLTVRDEAVDGAEFAENVHQVLTDRRGWQAIDGVAFQRVSGATSDVDVVLASPDTTDAMCAPLGTGGWLSCFNGQAAVLNARRWFAGVESYAQDLVNYRRYLVSHEMGHYLGHQHVDCPAPGEVAPVMVQQTKSLFGCAKGPWPAGT